MRRGRAMMSSVRTTVATKAARGQAIPILGGLVSADWTGMYVAIGRTMHQLATFSILIGAFGACVPTDPAETLDPKNEPWPCESWLGDGLQPAAQEGLHTFYEWDEFHNLVLEEEDGFYVDGKRVEPSATVHTWTYDPTGRVALEERRLGAGFDEHWRRSETDGRITEVQHSYAPAGQSPQSSHETWTYDNAGRLVTRERVVLQSGQRVVTAVTYPDAATRVEITPYVWGSTVGVAVSTWINDPWTFKSDDLDGTVWDESTTRVLDANGRVLVEETRMSGGDVRRTEIERGANGAPQISRTTDTHLRHHTTTYANDCAR